MFDTFPECTIFTTRGDSCPLKFQRLDDAGEPILDEPDAMFFSVKKSTRAQNPIIRKTLEDMELGEDGYYHFTILPEETDGMNYGKYVFDVEVISGYKQTIAMGEFIVGDEVTFARNEV